jgi:cytosine deaminase
MQLKQVLLGGSRIDLSVVNGYFTTPQPETGEVIRGGMITPFLAEPHVHLDAVLLGSRLPNRSGTLREGIANWASLRAGLTAEDIRERALKVIGWYVRQGCLRIRTHVDTGSKTAVKALLALREELKTQNDLGCQELQVVAFPQEGIFRAKGRLEEWKEAVELGCDAVGAIPHFERTAVEGAESIKMAFELACRLGLRLDFHCDETDDPGSRNLEVVCAETLDRGMSGRVVAGHCTALHSYPNPYAAKVIELTAWAGVQVVANPLDNVVLQGRYDSYPKRRGLTRVDELWAAGASVGIGHDSVMDPWYPLGTANMLDPAYMLVHLGHLMSQEDLSRAVRTLWTDNHLPFGDIPRIGIDEPADFLWWPVEDPIELLRRKPACRVFRVGKELKL